MKQPTETEVREAEATILAQATETETIAFLRLTEYEASVVTGALMEFGERWPDAALTAVTLRGHVMDQLPEGWQS